MLIRSALHEFSGCEWRQGNCNKIGTPCGRGWRSGMAPSHRRLGVDAATPPAVQHNKNKPVLGSLIPVLGLEVKQRANVIWLF